MKPRPIPISGYDYDLPEQQIARYPLPERDLSQLLVYRQGRLAHDRFRNLPGHLPPQSLLVFNNTRVIRARVIFFKETGARIEILCLEPALPSDYERAFTQAESCEWHCMIGNAKKWKSGTLQTEFTCEAAPCRITAEKIAPDRVRFRWTGGLPFGRVLESLGRTPIPPYLGRETEAIDEARYQTVYARFEGSVAAPTAGLHFTDELIGRLRESGCDTEEVTLHVGAGTFLPVKGENAAEHSMHTECFGFTLLALKNIRDRIEGIVAVGTTTVRTLESLAVLGYRVLREGTPRETDPIGQWEAYDIPERVTGGEAASALVDYMERNGIEKITSSTRIMITPAGFRFRIVSGLITNFHQPRSTLLLLVSAFIGEDWKKVYDYALTHGFQFLSYGDSSLLFRNR